MDKNIIRLQSVEINNFKNVEHGVIEFESYKNKQYYNKQADIIGIYGQNGSGKTTVIEALGLLKNIVGGKELYKDIKDYIGQGFDTCTLKYTFYIENNFRYLVDYSVTLKIVDNKVQIYSEEIYCKSLDKENMRIKAIIKYNCDNFSVPFEPKKTFDNIIKANPENRVDLLVARKICYKNTMSFVFYDDVINTFKDSMFNDYYEILCCLKNYCIFDLFVIETKHSAMIPLNFMPMSFRLEDMDIISSGDIPINLIGSTKHDRKSYLVVEHIIEQMNIVLKNIIPNLQLALIKLSAEWNEKGNDIFQFEIVSIRDNVKIPLRYESEGIIKIISILSTLISVYNNPSVCLAVDEIDSGVYEYLLGELLSVIEKHAKGQLIFTSHNLRPLEKLNSNNIMFSTTNPSNRFIRITNTKETSNLRKIYLRSIDLGGLKEEVYQETNTYEIAYAFRKAGKIIE